MKYYAVQIDVLCFCSVSLTVCVWMYEFVCVCECVSLCVCETEMIAGNFTAASWAQRLTFTAVLSLIANIHNIFRRFYVMITECCNAWKWNSCEQDRLHYWAACSGCCLFALRLMCTHTHFTQVHSSACTHTHHKLTHTRTCMHIHTYCTHFFFCLTIVGLIVQTVCSHTPSLHTNHPYNNTRY